ncbi:MAG: ion channel [Acidimicrobiia bacterium]
MESSKTDHPERGWKNFESSSDAYVTVTGLLVLVIVLPILSQDSASVERVVTAAVVGATVTLTMAASRAPRWAINASWIIGIGALIVILIPDVSIDLRATATAVLSIMMVSAPFVILRRIIRHEKVTATTIWGAIAAYLAFGIAFSLAYSAAAQLSPGAFSGMTTATLSDTNYFSFVTMTTLGYGDIAPVENIPRALVVMQTLIGQIYLVVVVARAVSLLGKPNARFRAQDNE